MFRFALGQQFTIRASQKDLKYSSEGERNNCGKTKMEGPAYHVMLFDPPFAYVTKDAGLGLTREGLLCFNFLVRTNRFVTRIAFAIAHLLCKFRLRRDDLRLAELKRWMSILMDFLQSGQL